MGEHPAAYNPFARGSHPVGVQSDTWTDPDRDRELPVEIWYPAAPCHRGQDLSPETWDEFVPGWVAAGAAQPEDLAHQLAVRGAAWSDASTQYPLVVLVHGWAGFRREATFLGTHLASHGYVVVSPDVIGSTFTDVDRLLTEQDGTGDPDALNGHARDIIEWRKRDIPFLIGTAVAELAVRPTGVGFVGASFGGWSSVIAPAMDERVTAIVPMCPGNGDAPVNGTNPNLFAEATPLDWHTEAAALLLVADRDSLLPLYGQLKLLRQLPTADKQMVVLADADHNHFVDDIDTGQAWLKEFADRVARVFPDGPGRWRAVADDVCDIADLVPGSVAHTAWRGLTLAHFDLHLRGLGEAAELLADPSAMLAARGIEVTTVSDTGAAAR